LRLWVKAQDGYAEGRDPAELDGDDGRVLEALAGLSERDREALTLVAWDGLRPAEAAEVLGEPASRFRVRLHRAARRLRARLEEEPGEQTPGPHSDPACKGIAA
jgi:RNA polymerase sigma-70 factor (ECF subfamily)